MPRQRGWVLAIVVSIQLLASTATADELRGIAFAQRPVDAVTVRIWALGERLLEDRAALQEPLAVTSAVPGSPFSIAFPGSSSFCEVELQAPGHVSVLLRVAAGEGDLPAAWLPAGVEVAVEVLRQGRVVSGATVSGRPMKSGLKEADRRWRPAVSRTQTDDEGRAALILPRHQPFLLEALAADGAWGRQPAQATPSPVRLELTSIPLRWTLTYPAGDPRNGALLADATAPLGATATTDENGVAVVQVAPRTSWSVVARQGDLWGRWIRHGEVPPSHAAVFAETDPARVRWNPAQDVSPGPSWIPEALLRGVPRVARATFGVLRGRVIGPGGVARSGVPIWLHEADQGGSKEAQSLTDEAPLLPRAVSGKGGRFQIEGLPAGWFRLEAPKAGFAAATTPPLTADHLPAGELVLFLEAVADLRLRAVDIWGHPVAGVRATLLSRADLRSGVFAPRTPTAGVVARRTSTDDGQITLPDLRAGRYELRLRAKDLAVRSLDVELAAGGTDLGEVELEPATRLEGWVVDRSGRGVADVRIRATLGPPLAEHDVTFETTSDADGKLLLSGLPQSGELYLVAEGNSVKTLAPLRVLLPPAGSLEVVVTPELVIAGRVLSSAERRPVTGALVRAEAVLSEHVIETHGPWASDTSESDDEGVFELRLFPGAYQIRAGADTYQDRELTMVIDGDRDAEPLEIELETGKRLRGRVMTEAGRPASDIEVTAAPAGRGVSSSLRRRSEADGTFELDRLAPGRYELRAEGGDRGQARQVVEVPSLHPILLRLSPGAILKGRVITPDGSPVMAGFAHADPRGRSGRPEAQPLVAGRFRFAGLSAGAYTLRMSVPGWASSRHEVRLAEGELREIEIEIDQGGTVSGNVRGLEAQELIRCQILGGGTATQPEPDGSFVLRDMALGRQTITAIVSPSGPERSTKVELRAPGEFAQVEFDFDSHLRLRGTVRAPHGSMTGVSVVLRTSSLPLGTQTITDSQGAFELRAAVPGAATLTLVDQRGRLLLTEHLTIRHSLELDLFIEDLALFGKVIAEGSELAVPFARVHLRAMDGRTVERTTSSDHTGNFELTDLAAGVYALRADADGYGPAVLEVTLEEGSAKVVRLRLPPEESPSYD